MPPKEMCFIHMMAPAAMTKAATAPTIGQGLGSTR